MTTPNSGDDTSGADAPEVIEQPETPEVVEELQEEIIELEEEQAISLEELRDELRGGFLSLNERLSALENPPAPIIVPDITEVVEDIIEEPIAVLETVAEPPATIRRHIFRRL